MNVDMMAEQAGQAAALPKTYMNAEEASAFIGVAVQTLAKWRCGGTASPPYIKIGNRRVMYAVDDLIAWMSARRVHNTSEVAAAKAS